MHACMHLALYYSHSIPKTTPSRFKLLSSVDTTKLQLIIFQLWLHIPLYAFFSTFYSSCFTLPKFIFSYSFTFFSISSNVLKVSPTENATLLLLEVKGRCRQFKVKVQKPLPAG